MHFLYPAFLFALFLAVIPILIHLFNFRRYKKIVFSDIRFLKQITEQNKKQQTIKQWLILLARMLAIACLVLAFAQPFIPHTEQANHQNRWISLYIDNGFSMQANSKEGSLLEIAKSKAKQIAEAYRETDQFQILTNDFEGKHQRLMSRADCLRLIDEITVSPMHRSLSELLKRQESLGKQMNAGNGQFYWVSDFQKNMEPGKWMKDSVNSLHLIAVRGENKQNVWIDTAWFSEPILKIGAKNKITLIVKNESESDFDNQPVVLKIDGVQKAIQNITCKAGSKAEVSVNFTLNDYQWHGISLSITDYPIVFDDAYYLSAKAEAFTKILLIQPNIIASAELKKVYSLDPFYQLNLADINQINYSDFSNSSLIILNEPNAISSGLSAELQKYVSRGGVLALIPSANPADLLSIQNLVQTMGLGIQNFQRQDNPIAQIEIRDPLFEGVFSKVPELAHLPKSFAYWQLSGTGGRTSKLMHFSNELPFLMQSKKGSGHFFLFASSFDKSQSDIAQHPIFVPLMLRLPFQAKSNRQSSFTLGEQSSFSFDAPEVQKILSLKNGQSEHLVEVSIQEKQGIGTLNGQVREAGLYALMNGNSEWAKIAFNYPRSESSQALSDMDELAAKTGAKNVEKDLGLWKATLDQAEKGTHLWRWALLLALLFLLIEMLLLKSIKN